MALELGVSPHAVEKRLKMARTKLGLSSSLEAARLLAASEEYQRTGPHAADLPTSARLPQSPLHRPQVVGASIVILATAAILVLAAQLAGNIADNGVPSGAGSASTAQAPVPAEQDRTRLDRQVVELALPQDEEQVMPTAAEIEVLVTTNFRLMDEDKSGYIEEGEISERSLEGRTYARDVNGNFRQTGARRPSRSEYIAPNDHDADGKWDFSEFREWLTPHLRAGIPVKARADIESISRQ